MKTSAPIIDIHSHQEHGDSAYMARMLKAASFYGISKICLLGDVMKYGYSPGEKQVRAVNDDTIRIVRLHPVRLIGFCYLNPKNSRKFILEEINRCVLENNMKGIKIWSSVNARSMKLDPVMQKAGELDIPVLHHAWYKTAGFEPNESNPADIAGLASRFPGTKIIMAHLSGCRERGINDVKPYKNVYVDTCGSQPASELTEYAVRTIGASRVLYGTDYPCRDFPSQLSKVFGARITEKQKRQILYENAVHLLKIERIP